MPRYEYWFRVSPRGSFGLSEPGVTVLPAGQIDYIGPTIDSRTGNLLTPGTESVLRRLEEQVSVELEVDGASVVFADDILQIALEAASPEAAARPVTDLVNRLMPMVSFGLERLISVELIQATNEAGTHVPFRRETINRFTTYDLGMVREALNALPGQLERVARDPRLSTALLYFAKGLALEPLLVTERSSAIRSLGVGTALLASEVFLNYWKVVETLLGVNPTNTAFRLRCAKLGVPQAYIVQELQP